MRTRPAYLAPFTFGVLATACSAGSARESTVTGTAALSTFHAAPSAITARDEAGRVSREAVGAQGEFSLPLIKGHTYRLALESGGVAVPVVFPRSSGRVDTSFVLKSSGALLPLGQVRYHAAAPVSGFHVLAARAPAVAPGGDCADCVNDDPTVMCEETESEGRPGAPETDHAEQADMKAEMAVGDENVPEEVDGCDDNLDLQQEGEH